MRSNLLRLVITFLILLGSSSAFAQPRIDVLDERILTPPDPGPLYQPYVSRSTKPVWSGTDWAVVWRDNRALEGSYAQRIAPDGSIAFSPNRRIGSQYPHSLVQFGTGYLMSHDGGGLSFLNHELEPFRILGARYQHLASTGEVALAWIYPGMMRLLTSTSIEIIDPSEVMDSTEVNVIGIVAGEDSFLIAWFEQYSTLTELHFNIIDTTGKARFDEPRSIGPFDETMREPTLEWDGSRYVVAWYTSEPPGGQSWVTTVHESETPAAPVKATSSARRISEGPQLVQVGHERLLLVWAERGDSWQDLGTRGLLLHQGKPEAGEVVLADQRVIVSSDGEQQLALLDYSANLRLLNFNSSLPLNDDSVTPITDWIQLRRGTPDRRLFVTASGTSAGLWSTGDFRRGTMDAGTLVHGMRRLEPRSAVPDAWQYQLAANGSRNLAVWGEEVRDADGRSRPIVMAQQLSHDGNFLGEPLELTEGATPGVTAHGDGWLVTWTGSMDERLQYVTLDADGLPSAEPRLIAEPILEPGFTSPQLNPSFVRVGPSAILLFWQEGAFQGFCRITCPALPGPGKIRSIRIENGAVVQDSLQSYPSEQPRIRPVAEMMGKRIFLTFLEQGSPSKLGGLFLDPNGEPVSSELLISSESHRASEGSTHSIVALDDAFVVIWDRYGPRNDSGSEILAAVVRSSGSQVDVDHFLLSDPVAGGRFPTAKRIGPSSLVVIYDRPVEGGGYGGTWQIVARQVTIDIPTERKRSLRRR